MGHQSIGYHTRDGMNNTVKLTGGSFGGAIDMETVNRLVKSHFTVKVRNSGSPVFVDRQGREVSVYITIDPGNTDAGKAALAEDRRARAALQSVEDDKRRQVENLLDGMSADEALQRLGGS